MCYICQQKGKLSIFTIIRRFSMSDKKAVDTNGEKAIYGGNFAMKASRILFL